MKELFNTKSLLFTECQNSIPSPRYSCLSTAKYGENGIFCNTKWNIINGPNNDFLDPKIGLKQIFDGFACFPCHLHSLYHSKTKNTWYIPYFGKY